MTTMRKPAAWMALLLSFLMAIPTAALADDTELFTTSANPNVLLMLDITGSMDTKAAGTSTENQDGEGNSNSRMDILWKVVYTLLNADLSVPTASVTATGTLAGARTTSGSWDTYGTCIYAGSTQYNKIRLANFSSTEYGLLPSSGTVVLGSGSVQETLTYTSKQNDSGTYYLNFTGRTFSNNWSVGNDDNLLLLGVLFDQLPDEQHGSHELRLPEQPHGGGREHPEGPPGAHDVHDQFRRIGAPDLHPEPDQPGRRKFPPFTTSYKNIWDNTTTYAHYGGGTPTARALNAAQTFFKTATSNNTVDICRPNYAVLITDGEDTMGGLDGSSGNGYGPDYYCGGSFNANGWSCGSNTGQVARHNSVINRSYLLANPTDNAVPHVGLFAIGVGITGTDADLKVQRNVLRRAAEQLNATRTNAPIQHDRHVGGRHVPGRRKGLLRLGRNGAGDRAAERVPPDQLRNVCLHGPDRRLGPDDGQELPLQGELPAERAPEHLLARQAGGVDDQQRQHLHHPLGRGQRPEKQGSRHPENLHFRQYLGTAGLRFRLGDLRHRGDPRGRQRRGARQRRGVRPRRGARQQRQARRHLPFQAGRRRPAVALLLRRRVLDGRSCRPARASPTPSPPDGASSTWEPTTGCFTPF